MRITSSSIVIALALAGCSGMQPHPTSTASATPTCDTSATTGSHIIEKNNCDKRGVSVMSGDAMGTAMRQSNPGSVSGH